MLAEHRDSLILHGVEGVAAVGLADIEEHSLHTAQRAPGEFQRGDGVVECRGVRVGDDGLDLRVLLLDSGFDGRYIV